VHLETLQGAHKPSPTLGPFSAAAKAEYKASTAWMSTPSPETWKGSKYDLRSHPPTCMLVGDTIVRSLLCAFGTLTGCSQAFPYLGAFLGSCEG